MRKKYEKRICYIRDPDQLAKGSDCPWEVEKSRGLQCTRNRCWRRHCWALAAAMHSAMPQPRKIRVIVELCSINLERSKLIIPHKWRLDTSASVTSVLSFAEVRISMSLLHCL